jgi:outer membrane protein TolC
LAAQKELALSKAAPLLERLAARQLLLEQAVKKEWLKLYQFGKQQEVIEEHLEIYESLEAVALARVENNQGTSVDVFKIQLQRKELQQRIALLEIEKAKPQAQINRVLGRVANANVSITGFLGIPELPVDLENLLTRIGTDHPMLRIFELQQAISEQALAVNSLDEKPDFTIGLDYFLVAKRTDAEPMGNGRDILMPHLAVNIPLNKGKYQAKRQEETLKIKALDQRAKDQLNTFNAMVESALAEYRRAESDISFIDEQVYLLRTTLRVAQTDYANNRRSFAELLQLQDQIIAYQERHLKALVAMHMAMADLEFYLLF